MRLEFVLPVGIRSELLVEPVANEFVWLMLTLVLEPKNGCAGAFVSALLVWPATVAFVVLVSELVAEAAD